MHGKDSYTHRKAHELSNYYPNLDQNSIIIS